MSRTYRRRQGNETKKSRWGLADALQSYVKVSRGVYVWVPIDPKSAEGRKRKAKYHSDAGTTTFKEPGPSWFRNLFSERPLRRKNKNELRRFVLDQEYEPMVSPKGKIIYWT